MTSDPTPPGGSGRWYQVFLVFLAGVTASVALLKASPAAPTLRADFALSLTQVGWLMSACTIAVVLLGTASGSLAQRVGPRRLALRGLFLLAVAGVIGAAARDTTTLLAARAAEGLGFVLVVVAGPTLVTRLAPPTGRSLALALWATWLPVGGVLVLAAGPALLARGGWPLLWIVGGAFALLMALALAFVREPPAAPPAAYSSAHGASPPPEARPWALATVFACFTFQLYAVVTFAPTLLTEEYGLPVAQAGAVTSLTLIAAAAVGWVSGVLMHRGVEPAHMVIGGLLLLVPLVPVLTLVGDLRPLGLALLLVHGLVSGAVATAVYAWAPALVPPSALGPAMGLLMAGNGAGILLGPPVTGALVDAGAGWTVAAFAPAAAAFVGAFIAMRVRRRAVGWSGRAA